jgi:hypothetical protein
MILRSIAAQSELAVEEPTKCIKSGRRVCSLWEGRGWKREVEARP